jgi:hypothetical protein
MNAISDTAPTLAVMAPFAEAPVRIRNIAHIRHQESDRLAAVTTELKKLGAYVVQHDDGWEIRPSRLHGAEIDTYDDHRIAMAFALVGLRTPGVVIRDPGCVAKTIGLLRRSGVVAPMIEVVAIDGPAGRQGSVSELARRLGYRYVDSDDVRHPACWRQRGIAADDAAALTALR